MPSRRCVAHLFTPVPARVGAFTTRAATGLVFVVGYWLGRHVHLWRHSAGAALPPYLRVEREASEGGHAVRITVSDYGAGVDESVLPHLAGALYRPDSARSRTAGGVGLGLYLCKLVGQAHGGGLALHKAQPGLEAAVTLP